MRHRGRFIVLPLVCLLLAACSSPAERPSSTVSIEQSTASDGLAEMARSVWSAYFESYSQALADPSVSPDSVAPYLSHAENEVIGLAIANFQDSGRTVVGSTSSRNFRVEGINQEKRSLTALVCVDNELSKIVDLKKKDITPKDRKRRFTLHLKFVTQNSKLVIDEDQVWNDSVC